MMIMIVVCLPTWSISSARSGGGSVGGGARSLVFGAIVMLAAKVVSLALQIVSAAAAVDYFGFCWRTWPARATSERGLQHRAN